MGTAVTHGHHKTHEAHEGLTGKPFLFFVIFVSLVVLPGLLPSVCRAQAFDPLYRFRALPTEHFTIYFHQGEDALADRLAPIAEETWQSLHASLGRSASRRTHTHVILVDQTDLANGWATPLPRDTIAIFAAWPAGSDSLATDDWLRLVFTHEFTHILHLDRSEGWARVLRGVFGRTPLSFPNILLPAWQVEGLAVYEESIVTGQGRMHAGDFRAIVDEAVRAGQPLSLDRVNGGLTRWPGGEAAYAYGLRFHAFLADRYGADTLRELADRTARSVPFLGSRAFKGVYGKSLGALWGDFEASLAAGATPALPPEGRRLTRHDYTVLGPRFLPACGTCPTDIYYTVRNADELPGLYRLRLAGGIPTAPERVTTRFLGSTMGIGRHRLYFDQQEYRRNVGLYSDLYSLDLTTGRARRLTHDARVVDPDLSPDEQTIAAVRLRPGQRDLVSIKLLSPDAVASISTLASDIETQFNAPRWSPDGRHIVAERQRRGELPRIVVVDVATGVVRELAGDPGTRWATPTWRPDGQAVVAAAAPGDGPFDLYEIDVASGRAHALTHMTGGATWPEVSPDGRSIVYVGYTATGFDLYQMPYSVTAPEAESVQSAAPERVDPAARVVAAVPSPQRASSSPYSPFSTLRPTWWFPTISSSGAQTGVGAITAGSDVLGYHAYQLSATKWIQQGAIASAGIPAVDWHASYVYARWRPELVTTASRETTFFRRESAGASESARQETKVELGVALPIVHVRSTQLVTTSLLRGQARVFMGQSNRALDRAAARFAVAHTSAHSFGNSISAERGLTAGATTELVRQSLGAADDATTVTADVRAYAPGFARHHVMAIRVAGGRTVGDSILGRTFRLGGAGPDPSPIDFDTRSISLLRGFGIDAFGGTHVVLMNADYRFPLVRLERGVGTWPIFVHTIHAAAFADVGHVWTTGFDASDLKHAVGGEISANVVIAYVAPVTIAFGAAKGHDGSQRTPDAMTWYGRVGYAF
jgi:hypothetical protein